jgi:hypothetical protein
MYTSNLLTSDNTRTATFNDDIAIFATHENPPIASMKLQTTNNKIDNWVKKWRIKMNKSKSMHITFTLRNQTCLTVQMGNVDLPQKNEVKYLGMHLDRGLTRVKHINSKRKQLNIKAKEMNWLLGRRSIPSIESNSSCAKQYSNPHGPMEFSYGGQPSIPTLESSSTFNPRLSDPFKMHLST